MLIELESDTVKLKVLSADTMGRTIQTQRVFKWRQVIRVESQRYAVAYGFRLTGDGRRRTPAGRNRKDKWDVPSEQKDGNTICGINILLVFTMCYIVPEQHTVIVYLNVCIAR